MSSDTLSFWDHLEEFRRTLISCVLIIVVSSIVCFIIREPLLSYLTAPTHSSNNQVQEFELRIFENSSGKKHSLSVPSGTKTHSGELIRTLNLNPGEGIQLIVPKDQGLAIFGPAEGMLTVLRLCMWFGLVISSPLWLFLLLRFASPGLKSREKSLVIPFFLLSCVFFTLGLLFSIHLTIPIANQFLMNFNAGIGKNLWALSAYIDFTLLLALAGGLSFESFVVLLFLVHFGIFTERGLREKRRHVIVGIFVLSAILTPPDVVTQILLAIPLIFLYEIAILYSKSRLQKNTT